MILCVDWAQLANSLLESIMNFMVNTVICQCDLILGMKDILCQLLGASLTMLTYQSHPGNAPEGHLI